MWFNTCVVTLICAVFCLSGAVRAQHLPIPYSFNGTVTTVTSTIPLVPFLTTTFAPQHWTHQIDGNVARLGIIGIFSLSRAGQFVVRAVQRDLTDGSTVVYNGSLASTSLTFLCNRTYSIQFFERSSLVNQVVMEVLNCSASLLPLQLPLQTETIRQCNFRALRYINLPIYLNRVGSPVLTTRALPYAVANATFFTNNTYNTHGLVMVDYSIEVNRTVTQLQQTEASATFDQPVGTGAQMFFPVQPTTLLGSGSSNLITVDRTTLQSGAFTPGNPVTLFTTPLNGTLFSTLYGTRQACQTKIGTTFSVFRRPVPGVTPEIAGHYSWQNLFLDCELTPSNPATAQPFTIQSTTVQSPSFLLTDRLGRVWNATVGGTQRASVWNEFNRDILITPNLRAINVSFPLDSAYLGSNGFNSSAWFASANLTYLQSGENRTYPEVQFTEVRGADSFLSFAVFSPTTLLLRCNDRNIITMQSNTTVPANIGPIIIDVSCGPTAVLTTTCPTLSPAGSPSATTDSGLSTSAILGIVLGVYGAVIVIAIISIAVSRISKSNAISKTIARRAAL